MTHYTTVGDADLQHFPERVSIPAFDTGPNYLDDDGIFKPQNSMPDSKESRGLKPSGTLRRFVLYRQKGRCAACKMPEWATRALQMHRKQPKGLYSIYNVVALCSGCHAQEHQRLKGASTL